MISPKAAADRVKSVVNAVTAKVVGYDRKTPELMDFYEGEAPLDWESINHYDPLAVVFQATVGAYGRHGDNKPDRAVRTFIAQAQSNHKKYGVYHLLLPDKIPEQTNFYIHTVEELGGLGNMPPITDIEVDWIRGTGWANQIKQHKDLLEDYFNQRVLAYTSKYYASFANDKYGNPPSCFKEMYGWMAGYLWVPYIDANVMMPHSYLANGFLGWAAWQYWDRGKSSPPRDCPKFPANDLSLISPWFETMINQEII
jgi:hypothetical protein